MPLDEEKILEVLKQVYDPEIPVDIVNLGLVYGVKVKEGRVEVKMTTTAPGCPVGSFIAAEAERAIRELLEVERVIGGGEEKAEIHVEMVDDPPWNIEMISEEGRRILGWG